MKDTKPNFHPRPLSEIITKSDTPQARFELKQNLRSGLI